MKIPSQEYPFANSPPTERYLNLDRPDQAADTPHQIVGPSRAKRLVLLSMAPASSSNPRSAPSSTNAHLSVTPTEGARILQDRLHKLLSRLAETIERVKKWPEAKGDDGSMHIESTSQLITNIRHVITALQRVEDCVKDDSKLREMLTKCRIPLDLLDLMDYTSINPECFSRGLLRESLGQLAGLKRRKLALELLGTAVQSGIAKRTRGALTNATSSGPDSDRGIALKRTRDEENNLSDSMEPPSKKVAS